MKYCTKCGKALEDDVKFCANCGHPTSNVANESNGSMAPASNGSDNGGNKKTIIILAVALACVVVICAVVLVIFAMKNNETEEVATTSVNAETTLANNENDLGRYNSLTERFNAAKLKAANRGVSVKNQKNAAKEALDQYKTAIDNHDTALMAQYGDEAEKYVSKLEKATNKANKKKDSSSSKTIRSQYNVPESEKTNFRVAPTSRVGAYYFDNILDDDVDRYAATTLAINEYYARHGCQFVTPALQEYFEHQRWYTNLGKATSSVSLSGVEAKNAARLQKDRQWYKKNMAGASGEASDFSYEYYDRVARMVD